MNSIGLEPDEIPNLDFTCFEKSDSIYWEYSEYKGAPYECCVCPTEEGVLKFYTDGGRLAAVSVTETDGGTATVIELDAFRTRISDEDIDIPEDFAKVSYITFISDLLSGQM